MIANLIVVAATSLLVLVSIGMHFEVLRALSAKLPRSRLPRRFRVGLVIVVAVATHIAESLVFALGIGLLIQAGYGEIAGADLNARDVVYFSITTYTSLGYGDLVPVGALRILCGVEALTGLVLIAWTASFTYVEMQRYWRTED
ncbi:MAG: two pore domain potassium channel family protein [Deltaproteobacteria bacterium]|nr:two pore domain potassium channel family protein [Deltaproteobacteria bacterium]MBW2394687.1 two pore domain potassium channel family protein [Deltaproteobacteria bacterium]